MKKIKLSQLWLACILFGCQQAELIDPNENSGQEMKTVTISAGMDMAGTKASLDSHTGQFSWQSGDQLSVLVTDGNFYTFTLDGQTGHTADFIGEIPQGEYVTTVALYPAAVENGAANTLLTDQTLDYPLPAEYDYREDCSNVPMVAVFGENEDHMSFKQIGGVMRFVFENMPTAAKFIFTVNDKKVTGSFPIDINEVGTNAITATEGTSSSVSINWSSDVDGAKAVFNVPVPTGTYDNFNVQIIDMVGTVLFTKDYSAQNTVNRATLLNMSEQITGERSITINEVWPFFSDAKVFWTPNANADGYAIFIDNDEVPFTTVDSDVNEAFFGGDFDINSNHKVQVAIIKDGNVVEGTKSHAFEFKTGNIVQRKVNVGATHVCVEWDDISNTTDKTKRGYYFELYDTENIEGATPLYSQYAYDIQTRSGGTFETSSWVGISGGKNQSVSTRMSIGFLSPSKTYYFRIRPLRTGETYNPTEEEGDFYGACSDLTANRPGDKFSKLVPLTTEAKHIPVANEVLYEGFDDITLQADFVSMAPGVTPRLLSADYKSSYTKVADMYKATAKVLYPQFLNSAWATRKWDVTPFNTAHHSGAFGISGLDGTFNEYAGSLNGWYGKTISSDVAHGPAYGYIWIGKNKSIETAYITTTALDSENLTDTPTWCDISFKVCQMVAGKDVSQLVHTVKVVRVDASNNIIWASEGMVFGDTEVRDGQNYTNAGGWETVQTRIPLAKGDKLRIEKPYGDDENGRICIDDILVVSTGEPYIESGSDSEDSEDNLPVSEPDDTDYDVYGMEEFPISFWWAPPTSSHNYDEAKTIEIYRTMKESGINVVNYFNHLSDQSLDENLRLIKIVKDLGGMKFISRVTTGSGGVPFADDASRIQTIKDNFCTQEFNDIYIGEHVADEPNYSAFDAEAAFVNNFVEATGKEAYVNLYPIYASSGVLGGTYENHVSTWIQKANVKSLSFDHYCLLANGTETESYFKNLDLVRSHTLNHRMPYWFMTQSGQTTATTRAPSVKEQRWSVWSSVALGSKGIQYFCYWAVTSDPNVVGTYMIDADGNPTDMYYTIQQLNADLKPIGKKLLNCHADGAIMSSTKYYPLYDNDGKGRTQYGPIKKVNGSVSILCGCFRDARKSEASTSTDPHPYKGYKALVTHQMPNRGDFSVNMNIDPLITEVTLTHNTNEPVKVTLSNLLNANISDKVSVTFTDGVLTLNIPEGEAVLLEF